VKPLLRELWIADPPAAWESLGFTVDSGVIELGGIRVLLGGDGRGITAWSVEGAAAGGAIDGLDTRAPRGVVGAEPSEHPNGAVGLDHVVVMSPDFDRTAAALDAAGMPLRRVRDAGGFRQGFRRLGPAILELVEARDGQPDDSSAARPGEAASRAGDRLEGDARFWGLVVIVRDLDALASRLGDRLRAIKPAVQPGRRIATLDRSAGSSAAVAFMDAEQPDP
jgi:hypothetical protein